MLIMSSGVMQGVDMARAGWYAYVMTFFCFLWIPLFYFFWRSIRAGSSSGWVWALIAGSVAALLQFFAGPLVTPGGFGFSRWLSGFVDIVALPALAPLAVFSLLFFLKLIPDDADFTGFALLWLIPGAATRSLTWGYIQHDPIVLVLVPFLWTAIAVGVPFFVNIIMSGRPAFIVLACHAILFVPFIAATSWWAFFSQQTILGFVFLFAASVPMLFTVVLSFVRGGE